MTPPLSSLEYEEEDLFGSDDETAVQATLLTSLSTVRPIPVSSAASSSVALSSKQPRAPTSDAEKRLAELRERKRGLVEEGEGSGRGVSSLKSCCLTGASCLIPFLMT